MSSAELINKTELTSIAGTEWVYLQEAGSPYTVKKTLFNTIKTWIMSTPLSTVAKTGNYTITDSDGVSRIEVDTTSADVTITMPLMANNRGRRIEIANVKGGTYKVIISPNATDANKLSGDGLSAIWLPKIGDFVVFQESVTSGYWEIVNERITSQLRLNTYAGYGSTDTKIMRFTNSVENVGNMFSENHSSGYSSNAKGLEITINRSGRYGVIFNGLLIAGGGTYGLSLNSSQLTTSIFSTTISTVINASAQGTLSSYTGASSIGVLNFKKNDVIRPHADGFAPASSFAFFTCTYLGQ